MYFPDPNPNGNTLMDNASSKPASASPFAAAPAGTATSASTPNQPAPSAVTATPPVPASVAVAAAPAAVTPPAPVPAAPAPEPVAEEPTKMSEIDVLKDRARMMNITFSNNIGADALRAKIQAKMDGTPEEPEEAEQPVAQETSQASASQTASLNPLVGDTADKPAKTGNFRQDLMNDAMRLIRVRITNLDPKKRDLHGEIFTVANEYIGSVKKFVPYGEVTENGWHLPYCIYRQLEKRKFLDIRTRIDKRTGSQVISENWVNEFSLEVLPPLSQEELNTLATAQIAAGSVG